MTGEQAAHDQQALAAGWTGVTGLEGWPPGIGPLARRCRGGGRWVGRMPRQPALELVQAGARDGTPQPIVPDVGEPLGQPMREKAANELVGRQGHGLPAMVLGILRAETDVAVRDREKAAIGQRDPVDIAAQVVQDLLRAWDGRFAVDDPPVGPDRRRDGQVGPRLTPQSEQPPARILARAWTGTR